MALNSIQQQEQETGQLAVPSFDRPIPGEEKDDEVLDEEQSVEMLRKIADIAIKDIGRGNKVTSLPAEIQQRLEEFKPEEESLLTKKEE